MKPTPDQQAARQNWLELYFDDYEAAYAEALTRRGIDPNRAHALALHFTDTNLLASLLLMGARQLFPKDPHA